MFGFLKSFGRIDTFTVLPPVGIIVFKFTITCGNGEFNFCLSRIVSSVCPYGLGMMPSQIIQASTGPTVQPAADHTMRRGPPPDTSTNLSTRLSTTMEQPWEGGIILNPAQQTLSLLIINTSKKIYIYTVYIYFIFFMLQRNDTIRECVQDGALERKCSLHLFITLSN